MTLGFKIASRAALFGCCSLAAMASAAHAADAPQAETRLDEVVVTAQRSTQNLQSVPVAVTALDQASLEKHSIADVGDLQFNVPNFQIRDESAVGGLTIGIRGISVSADNFAFDSAVGVYVNDVFIARANDFGATFYDVHSVQVLRGPQGTFFGRNTPAGAVLIESNGPGSTYGGYVSANLGGGGHGLGDGADRTVYRIDGAVDLPLTPVLGVRVAGFYMNDNGWGRSLFNGHRFYSAKDGALRATVEFRPTDRFDARLVVDHSEVNHGGPLFKELAFNPPAQQAYDQLHGGTAEQNQITASLANHDPYTNTSAITQGLTGKESAASLRMTYKIGDSWSLRSISGWRRLHRDQLNDNLGVPLAADFYTSAALRQQQLSQEVVLTGDITEQLHMVGGLFYFKETGSDQNVIRSNIAAPNTPFAFVNPLSLRGQDIKNTSKAVFMNLSYDILPTVTASVGYRYSEEDKYVFLNSTLPALGLVFVQGPQKFSDKVPLYDAKLSWQATPDLLVYGKYGTGYRAGGIGFRAANAQFQPETAKTYEAGAKWEFNIGSIPARFNAAAFHTDYQNFQISVVLLNPVRQTVINAGGAILKGAEFEFSAKPTSNLDVSASLGLLDSHYTSFIFNNATLGGLLNLTNNKLRDAPKVNFSASVGYTVPSTIGEWLFQADYAYSSSYEIDTVSQPNAPVQVRTNFYHQDPTNIFNARVRLREPFGTKVDVSLWAKNLTDQKVQAFSLAVAGLLETTYGEPLSYGVELRLPF